MKRMAQSLLKCILFRHKEWSSLSQRVSKTDDDDNEFDEDYIEMQVKLDESVDIIYEFQTFEHLIELSQKSRPHRYSRRDSLPL